MSWLSFRFPGSGTASGGLPKGWRDSFDCFSGGRREESPPQRATVVAFYPFNQWLVRRKGLDHRPYFVPSLWGPVGALIILFARPLGWRRSV